MKVTYIYHSGFMIETESATLLFDYFKGELPAFPADKPLAVFASHKHKDHLSFRVFEFENHPGGVHYIFGNDIKLSDNYLKRHNINPAVKEKIHRMSPHTELELKWEDKGATNQAVKEKMGGVCTKSIKIHTLKSTDAGVAFYVRVGNERIYHAGDLNWWHWEGEETEFNRQQKKGYQEEIHYLRTRLEEEKALLDVAFIPLDPRLEKAYSYGMDYFLSQIPVKEVYPMHMWENYDVIARYLEHCEKDQEKRKYTTLIKNTFYSQKQHNSITN